MAKHSFIKKWKKTNFDTFRRMYPEVSDREINKFLDKVIKENLKNPACTIDNNYVGKTLNTTLLDVCDWIEDVKPICAGNGVFFRNQNEVQSPLSIMIAKFLTSRKSFKSKLRLFDKRSYEYKTYDRKQLSEKICANSIYGTFGNVISFLYNKYTAPSVTGTGQSLISTTEQAFEFFMAGNVMFNYVNECITYMHNILSEKYSIDSSFLMDVTERELIDRLKGMFYGGRGCEAEDILERYVSNLSQDEINRIYYKNNLYEFSRHSQITSLLTTILLVTKEFKDPNEVPEEATPYLTRLWDYYKDFVFYNYSPIDRIQRLKNDKRKCVLTIDTDSNFLNLNPWVEFVTDNIIKPDYRFESRDAEQLRFITTNTMAFIITHMSRAVLKRYVNICNVPEDYHHYINIKNEFLMSRVILTPKKKKYMSSIRLREGDEIYPEKLDIKGMDFKKSTATEKEQERFTKILKTRILEPKEINISDILSDLREFEKDIKKSLENGEKEYAIPKSVKELEAYADSGISEQGVRAVITWNYIYPDMEIELPAKINIVKLTLTDDRNLDKLRINNPEIYKIVEEKILNNKDERISSKKLPVIAIPKSVDKIPEWIIPFIDYDTITYNVLSKFYSVLESLGVTTVSVTSKEYFSNILDI